MGGDLKFEQLWVNGQRADRARTPDWWEFDVTRGVTETPLEGDDGRNAHTFSVRPEVAGRLAGMGAEDLRDTQVLVFHKWDTTREWLQSVDPGTGTFVTHGALMKHWNPMTRDCLFYLEANIEFLDSPGEWFFNLAGWLYYMPRAGEDMKRADVVAPRIDRFLTIKGGAGDSRVRHLRFQGLKFRHGEWRIPREGLGAWQAAMNVESAAVQVDGASDVRFVNGAVEHIGVVEGPCERDEALEVVGSFFPVLAVATEPLLVGPAASSSSWACPVRASLWRSRWCLSQPSGFTLPSGSAVNGVACSGARLRAVGVADCAVRRVGRSAETARIYWVFMSRSYGACRGVNTLAE